MHLLKWFNTSSSNFNLKILTMKTLIRFLNWLLTDEWDEMNHKRQEQGKPPIVYW